MRFQSGTIKTLWVVILVLPIVTGALFAGLALLGLVVRLFGRGKKILVWRRVSSDGVARVDDAFVATWRAAFRKMPGVVIAASAPVRDNSGVFRFDASAGTLLPLQPATSSGEFGIVVPVRHAVVRAATLATTGIVPAPLEATPRHLAWLLKALAGRPYGWGNTNFDNDCSAELQSIFAAFGVWLPRHSSTQMSAGDMIDLSASTPAQRLDYVARHGQPMRTLIYIGGM
jgi:cell wall-associated NlpC family hydrolase